MKPIAKRVWLGALAALAAAALSQEAGAENAYVGVKKCKVCHLKEFKSWSETKMSSAFELLKAGVSAAAKTKVKLDPTKDYTKDASCLPCHTTGYGKPGGFVDLATTPDLVGVQCEICHGPGATYTLKQNMSLQNKEYKRAELVKVGLVGQIGKDTCANCHNSRSPFFKDFKFEERKAKGIHEQIPLKYAH